MLVCCLSMEVLVETSDDVEGVLDDCTFDDFITLSLLFCFAVFDGAAEIAQTWRLAEVKNGANNDCC